MKSIRDLTQEQADMCFRLAFNEPMGSREKRIVNDGIEIYSYGEKTQEEYVLTLRFDGEFAGENRGLDGKQSKPIAIRNKLVADYINSL